MKDFRNDAKEKKGDPAEKKRDYTHHDCSHYLQPTFFISVWVGITFHYKNQKQAFVKSSCHKTL